MRDKKFEIKGVKIDGLFEEFNYRLLFNNDVNIITSPNGYGKSTVLRMVYNFSNANYFSFFSEVFSEITFLIEEVDTKKDSDLESERYLGDDMEQSEEQLSFGGISNVVVQIKKMNNIISITDLVNKRNKTVIIDIDSDSAGMDELWSSIDDDFPYINRVAYDRWENEITGESYNKETIFKVCGDAKVARKGIADIEWIDSITNRIKSYYITTDRIRVSEYSNSDARYPHLGMRRRGALLNKSMINLLAADVKSQIQQGIRSQFELGRRRESTFPQRLIQSLQNGNSTVKADDVMKSIRDIQRYEERFSSLGILPNEKERTTEQLNQFFSYQEEGAGLAVLKVYLDDIKSKYKVLDGLATKLNLFKTSVNKLLSFKKIEISLESGFVISPIRNDEIHLELTSLSSGEQHLIVMLGKLVFGASKGDVVLIDEPEISFHPEWQEDFIDIINEIRNIKDFKVIMATGHVSKGLMAFQT